MHLPVPSTNIAFTVFGIDVMWYGVMLTLGIVVGGVLCYRRAPKFGVNPPDRLLDILLWAVPIATICSRLYYVAFEWGYYKDHLNEILNIRGGGLAIHGAIIGGVLVGFFCAKAYKLDFRKLLDLCAPGFAVGQAIGRWGTISIRKRTARRPICRGASSSTANTSIRRFSTNRSGAS